MNTLSKLTLSACALAASGFASGCASTGSPASIQRAMAGAWSTSDGGIVLSIEGTRCVQASEHAQTLFELSYRSDHALRTQLYLGQPVPGGLELDGESLILVDPVGGSDQRFERLSSAPERVSIEPFPLGQAPAEARTRQAIAQQLTAREQVSASLRNQIEESMHAARLGGRLGSFEEQMQFMASPSMVALREELVASYASNTAHIEALLKRTGWITREAYGSEAQLAAFNMVRFGGNLRIMRSVLPALEAELGSSPDLGFLYTLLYDSTQLSLGNKQLYGTLLLPDLDGRMRLRRVAKRGSLDQRRRAMGLPPIREFLANFEQQFGPIEVED